jgi:WhiB family redox-sensing transcriptional regulator
MFFPEDNKGGYSLENQQAKKICRNCVCVEECLTYALHFKVQGVWGGTTMNERDVLRKKLHITGQPITNERHIA